MRGTFHRVCYLCMVALSAGTGGCGGQATSRSLLEKAPSVLLQGSNLVDLGIVGQSDELLTAEFQIQNDGLEPLVIHKVEPSCTCTKVAAIPSTVSPGSLGRIVMRIARTKLGRQNASATILCNSLESPVFKVHAAWEVRGKVTMTPDVFPRIDLLAGESTTVRFAIAIQEEFTFAEIIGKSKLLSLNDGIAHSFRVHQEHAEFEVSTAKTVQSGTYYGTASIVSSSEEELLSVDWTVNIANRLYTTHKAIWLRPSSESGYRCQLVLHAHAPSILSHLSVTCSKPSNEEIPFQETKVESNENIRILDLTIRKELGDSLEMLVIRAGDNDQESAECKIPVFK